MKRYSLLLIPLLLATGLSRPVQATPVVGLAVTCTLASAKGQPASACRTDPEPFDNEIYNYVTDDTLVRKCDPAGCSWGPTPPIFTIARFGDLAPTDLVDSCRTAVEPASGEPVWKDATTSNCKQWLGVPKSQILRATAAPPVVNTTGIVTLTWTPPTQNVDGTTLNDLQGFYIYQGSSPTSLVKLATSLNAAARSLQLPLPVGTFYFSLSAYAPGGESPPTSLISVVVAKPVVVTKPGTPTQFKATVTITVP